MGAIQSLTGPIARGDVNTIREHLRALAPLPAERHLYAQLGLYTAGMAAERRPDEAEPLRQISRLMHGARRPIVGVMGSGVRPDTMRAARAGQWLASLGVHLLTGGGGGTMEAVCRAFCEHPGRAGLSIGILPSEGTGTGRRAPPGYPNPWVDVPVYTHLTGRGADGVNPDSRNAVNILSSDVIIALPGAEGTASETVLAVRHARPVIAWLDSAADLPGLPSEVRIESDWEKVKLFVIEALNGSLS